MKPHLLFFLIIISVNLQAQVMIDRNAAEKYQEVFRKMPERFRSAVMRFDTSSFGTIHPGDWVSYAIPTVYRMDTLNKNEQKYSGNIVIEDDIESYDTLAHRTDVPLMSTAEWIHDTVTVNIPFLFDPRIECKLAGTGVKAWYNDYRKYDSIFRTGPRHARTNTIRLPMEVLHFGLSDTVLKPGTLVYGSAELRTPVFYEESSSFTSGFVKQQFYVSYVFQLRIMTSEELHRRK
jgi:hypothetical protein